ncbi:MAG: FAD-dependent oxidoreductase [Coriobacteriales bacterium]|jgi:fumarate reductase flavoprotein subunit
MAEATETRRTFVTGSAALAAAFVAAGSVTALASASEGASSAKADNAASPAGSANADATAECDVVVAGAGITGMLAALGAEEAGAKVIVVEKRIVTGGSAAKSSAFMVTAESSRFDAGVDTSIDTLMDYLMGVHSQSEDTTYPDQDFLRSIFSQSGETIEFMLGLGMQASFTELSTPVTVWQGGGQGMMDSLTQIAQDRGIDIRLKTAARTILTDDSGTVCGLRVEDYDGVVTDISAKKVILACGGTSYDKGRMQRAMPTLSDMTLIDFPEHGDTGDGFGMAQEVGAKLAEPLRVLGAGGDIDQTWRATISDRNLRPSASNHIIVNAKGKRFMNEAPSENTMMTYYLVKEGSTAYYILYDASDADMVPVLENGATMGAVLRGDTLDALAEAMGVDTTTLGQTIETYNGYCEEGTDGDFGKDAENLVAYDTSGAMYAVKYYCSTWGTIGGVDIDDTAHVLDADGNVIENLFAGGCMANRRLFSDFYIGGNSLATSATVGRIAGQTAAAEIAQAQA